MSHHSSVELLEYTRLTLQLIERYPHHLKKMLTSQANSSFPLNDISRNLNGRPLIRFNRRAPSGLLSQPETCDCSFLRCQRWLCIPGECGGAAHGVIREEYNPRNYRQIGDNFGLREKYRLSLFRPFILRRFWRSISTGDLTFK